MNDGNAADSGSTEPESARGEESSWHDFFGFDAPYDNQADAIQTAIAAGRENGYLAMEGPCGTGKTMAALTAAAYLVRRTDLYDTVLVVTPVKQQLHQFVSDLRAMNESLERPLSGIALVGKADLCPYEREGVFPTDIGVHTRCDDLRETTAELVASDGPKTDAAAATRSVTESAIGGVSSGSEVWWDPETALDLVRSARQDADTHRTLDDALSTAGVSSPYPRHQPAAPERTTDGEARPLYCPFEADWYARNKGSPIGFDQGDRHVLTTDEYLPEAVERGTCPHRAMGVLLEAADVVIGNYNHLFDPQTRSLTAPILDDRTFVIVDEAHRLEDRVRSLLSDSLGRQSIRRARGDHATLVRYADQSRKDREYVSSLLEEFDVSLDAVARAESFYDDVLDWLHDRIQSFITREFDAVESRVQSDALPEEGLEIPLRDPSVDERDELTDWLIERGYQPAFVRELSAIGTAVERAIDLIDPERSCVSSAIGALFGAWFDRDHATYFREIELAHSPRPGHGTDATWEQVYTPRLIMFNCMPAAELARTFESVGGGVLMSATLEPLSVFKEVSGLETFESSGRNRSRPVITRTYELPFPRENRASWIVDATPYTARNRGRPDDDESETRQEYRRILRTIATSPGNVMLCLPNYTEAAWAASMLRETIDKPVLVDESSTAEATDDLKQSFVSGDPSVLVTSTRGTLTEGVDYDGDKLHTCAVVGVPLVNVGSSRVQAVKHAYGDVFGEDRAFDYALTIPAVRRARQAIGRVIRGPDERGVRILIDRRYTPEAHYGSVNEYLPPAARDEFVRMTPMFLDTQFEQFWGDR